MNHNFETELPSGYEPVLTVDAASKKFSIIMNVIVALFSVLGIVVCVLLFRPSFDDIFGWKYFAAFAVLLLYIVLHELTHGAAYKLLTGHKLTFGFTATVAYCGVPDIFVYRKTAMVSLLAPFVVFNIVFLLGAFLLPESIDRFFSAVLFVIHFGGCAGDLYDTFLYLTKLRDPTILMQDTGPKQTFYAKQDE